MVRASFQQLTTFNFTDTLSNLWSLFCFQSKTHLMTLGDLHRSHWDISYGFQHDVLRHCFFPFFWFNLNGLQLFRRLEVSQKRPEARACCSHSSNASSSSSSIISASKSHGYRLELLRGLFSKPTMFTWKLGRWVLGLQAIPCIKQVKNHPS